MSQNWSVFHFTSQTQVNNLNKEQLQALLEKYTPTDLPHLYLWNENLEDWKPLRNFPDLMSCLLESLFQEAEKAPPPIPKNLMLKVIPETSPLPLQDLHLQARETSSDGLPTPETRLIPRKHPRHPMKLRTLIRYKDSVFRTFTTTVSAEGFGVAHEIPAEFLKEGCYGVISSADGNENFRFEIKPVCKNAAKVVSRADQLQVWIQSHLQNAKDEKSAHRKGLAKDLKHRLAVP